MTATETKQKWANSLAKAAKGISNIDKLQVCINLDINPATFDRYTSGKLKELRRLELADPILAEIKKVRKESKSPATA